MTDTSPVDLASLRTQWPALTHQERVDGLRLLPAAEAHDLFHTLSAADQAALIGGLSQPEATIWMRLLPPDDAADVLQVVTPRERLRLEEMLDRNTLRETTALLAYAEDEAGGLMNPRFPRLRPEVSVDVAIRYLRRQTHKPLATLYYAYVLDSDQRLLGVVSFAELLAAPGEKRIDQIMQRDAISVPEHADQEAVARIFATNDLTAVPVLDENGCMRGVITVDDIVDVVQEEATEDIQKLGGVEALGAPYLAVSFGKMLQKRGGWLSALFLGEMLTATAMGYFENEIEKAVVLALFVPLIISSGGNSGSQAATLIVRSLAIGELRLRDWFRVLWREVRSGLALGAWLGFIGFLRVILWQYGGFYEYGPHYLLLAVTVWASLVGVVGFGTLVGGMLPFLLRRLGFDPATSSAPFVATLVDVMGLVIYFGAAILVLEGTLL